MQGGVRACERGPARLETTEERSDDAGGRASPRACPGYPEALILQHPPGSLRSPVPLERGTEVGGGTLEPSVVRRP